MTTAYTSLLGLALPVTGELSGTWGDTVNNSITSLLDSAISGTTTISTDADITLTTTTGAANEAREAIILWTAGGTTTRNITAPAQSKTYIVINKSSSTQSIVLRGAGPTTGVTIIKGEAAVCAWNGSDFIKVSNISGAGVFSSITNTGLTSGRVVYSTAGGLETDSANLLYSGTDLTVYGLTVGRGAGAVATNTAVGASALALNTTGALNTAVGYQAIYSSNTNSNTGVGYRAGYNTTGSSNVFVGGEAGVSNTTASENVFVGLNAGYSVTTGGINVAIGRDALFSGTTVQRTVAIGKDALKSNTTASNNTAVGYQAGYANSTGTQNTAVGTQALYSNTTASSNSAFGQIALYSNTTGAENTSIGYQSMQLNTTGNSNTALGMRAMRANTTGGNNTAVGHLSLDGNTTGASNVALGNSALQSNTTASNNTAVGYQAGYSNTTAASNTAVGALAGYGITTGPYNTCVGYFAGYALTTGAGNTFVGSFQSGGTAGAGSAVTTGSKNVILGGYTGSAAPISATGSNYIVLSDGDGNVRQTIDSSGNVGIGTSSPSGKFHVSGGRAYFAASSEQFGLALKYSAATSGVWLGSPGADAFTVATEGGTERMRIDSSGNVLVGTSGAIGKLGVVTPTSGYGFALQGRSTDGQSIMSSMDRSGTVYTGNFTFPEDGSILFGRLNTGTNTERMRIDSSGNVGIGTSSPVDLLQINRASGSGITSGISLTTAAGSAGDGSYIKWTGAGAGEKIARIDGVQEGTDTGSIRFNTGNGADGFTERMRIDSSGNVLVGTTSSDGAAVGVRLFGTNQVQASKSGDWSFRMGRRDSTGIITEIYYNSSRVGDIATNGTGTSYNSASDYRLKENVELMTGALAKVAALKPVTYKWKVDGSDGQGFIAHELAEVVPDAVRGTKDEIDADGNPVYQGVDTSFLVATLTAAIQEQQALITSLTARITALEST